MRKNTYMLAGLRREFAQALGRAAGGDPSAPGDLVHLGAVILLVEPWADLAAIAPVRPYRESRASWLVDALTILRTEGEPMTARAIAKRLLQARSEKLCRTNLQRAECSLHAALERLEGRGIKRASGSPKRWFVEG
jgi:hypothetical protein